MQDGTNGMLIARSLTTVEWCKMLNDISESLCDDDVSREKILRALQIILQIAKRNGATYEDNFDASASDPAGSIRVDDTITGIKVFRDSLFIFCENLTFINPNFNTNYSISS